jgi:hypothetical protein
VARGATPPAKSGRDRFKLTQLSSAYGALFEVDVEALPTRALFVAGQSIGQCILP